MRRAVGEVLGAESAQALGDAGVRLRAGQALRSQGERDVLGDGRHDDLRVRVAEDQGDAAPQLAGSAVRVDAQHPQLPCRAPDEPPDQSREGALARAVLADHGDRPRIHLERDVAEGVDVAEAHADVDETQGRGVHALRRGHGAVDPATSRGAVVQPDARRNARG